VGHFYLSIDLSDLIKGVKVGRESTVEAEDLVLDDSSQGKQVEEVGVVLPNISIAIFAQALIIEAIYLSNLAGLVVASQDGDSFLEPHLQSNEEGDGFNGVVASVDVVTHK
jgi:hypothetical protein